MVKVPQGFTRIPVDHIKYREGTRGEIEACHCKECGSIIAGFVDSEGQPEIRQLRGREYHIVRQVYCALAAYCEFEMAMDDGSTHVTAVCQSCANEHRNNPQKIQDWHRKDLHALVDHHDRMGHTHEMDSFFFDRKPTGEVVSVSSDTYGQVK